MRRPWMFPHNAGFTHAERRSARRGSRSGGGQIQRKTQRDPSERARGPWEQVHDAIVQVFEVIPRSTSVHL